MKKLYQEVLITVTSFFRDSSAFEALKQEVFPELLESRPLRPIRIWVAGCSTEEEAYSLAICLLEFLPEHLARPSIQIFATDLSAAAIDAARQGIYLADRLTGVSPERLQRYFVPVERGYQINKAVRELCIFAQQNLLADPPFSVSTS